MPLDVGELGLQGAALLLSLRDPAALANDALAAGHLAHDAGLRRRGGDPLLSAVPEATASALPGVERVHRRLAGLLIDRAPTYE